eukprot:5206666-Prymnesium_polylepis.1
MQPRLHWFRSKSRSTSTRLNSMNIMVQCNMIGPPPPPPPVVGGAVAGVVPPAASPVASTATMHRH